MKIFIMLLMLISFSPKGQAAPNESFGHLYAAAGELYGLGALRIGGKNWEAGLMNSSSLGLGRVIYRGGMYAIGGGILTLASNIGLFGALGKEWDFWKIWAFRVEGNIAHGVGNYSAAQVHLGLSVGW
jgi:hypothetical protein